jgi:hypothetical protein
VWVLRGHVAPKTPADVQRLAHDARDVASAKVAAPGWGDMNRETIREVSPGDHHAQIRDNAPGPITVCLVIDPAVECKPLDVEPLPPTKVTDGRRWFGHTTTPFDVPPGTQ